MSWEVGLKMGGRLAGAIVAAKEVWQSICEQELVASKRGGRDARCDF